MELYHNPKFQILNTAGHGENAPREIITKSELRNSEDNKEINGFYVLVGIWWQMRTAQESTAKDKRHVPVNDRSGWIKALSS